MSSRRETTESERLLVVKWLKEGKSLREIALLIGVTHDCVQKILQKYKKTGSVANIPGRGRKEILSTTAKRKIIHSVKKDPREELVPTEQYSYIALLRLHNAPSTSRDVSEDQGDTEQRSKRFRRTH
ncbi:uncharacterized protein TNCT_270771 [Trichonephila clavata]|uniref:Paired domain-containing protein n=1 Tax=Trichonephila clavata TaxID=2740835 RepID=A0A8X6HCB5_TRICU|nr:uncharacterized protein TNCT_270771 [Trichonephila clavata]